MKAFSFFSATILILGHASLGFATSLYDDQNHLPGSFDSLGRRAVFADFQSANYSLTYNLNTLEAYADSEIFLVTREEGSLVFDSGEDPENLRLDGQAAERSLISTPDGATRVRLVLAKVRAGKHLLQMRTPLSQASFDSTGVMHLFGMTDLSDRNYLERYLPANFIFDRVAMHFKVQLLGANREYRIYTNGQVLARKNRGTQNFDITFPESGALHP